MKTLFAFPFLCFVMFVNAQNERFYYEYKSVKDSTEKEKVSKEIMILEATEKGSNFYNYSKYKRDSAVVAEISKGSTVDNNRIFSKSSRILGEADNSVTKTYPDYKVVLHTTISEISYKVPDERKIEWKIQQEKQKIGEWQTQKATAEFAGRQWVAWFAEDIPLPDGPYKFHGLPGLIVKVEDTKGYHSFELKGISKITDNVATAKEIYRPTEIEIDRKKHKKIFWVDRDDPAKYMKQMILGGGNVRFVVNGNQETDPNKMIKIFEESAKEKVKKDNNHLEIDMLTR